MDPVTQTNVTNTSDTSSTNTATAPANNTNTIIAGAFGGTLPVPPQVSETMPAFSFDEDDFGSTAPASTTPVPAHEAIADPFAGGVESLQQPQAQANPAVESVIVDAVPTTENVQESTIPEGTISLDSLEEPTQNEIPQNITSQENLQIDMTENLQTTTTETTMNETSSTPAINDTVSGVADSSFDLPMQEATTNDVSFDLPGATSEDTQTNTTPLTTEEFVTPTIQENTVVENTQDSSFDLPVQEAITNDVSFDLPGDTSEDTQTNTTPPTTEEFVTPTIQKEESATENISEISTENKDNNEATTETLASIEESQGIDDSIPTQSIAESRDDTSHDLQEAFEEFKKAFDTYTTFKNNTTLTLTGLRTEEEEINYTFNQESKSTITINKSNTSDILSFEQTESGVKVMINTDLIGYYGVDQVDSDTTHYLKEKLGKFTMMLTSEYEREEKKQREGIRKIKDTLKNF